MAKFLYQVFIGLYPFIVRIASPFNEKARLWIKGREGVLETMKNRISTSDPIIWIHCSSLGEFEQGRPLLERCRTIYPSYKILLTFFSPSGFEVRKNYAGADYIFYLPMDGEQNAATFYNVIKPKLIIFVKYEFWYYYLAEGRRRNIPLVLISGIFRKSQPFFTSYGSFHRRMLSFFTHIFVQNIESASLLKSIGFAENVSISGDTRFDRVVEIAENFQAVSTIESYCKGSKVIVAGSTWLEDDKELAHYANTRKQLKFLIAPHNIGKERLEECLKLYKNSTLFSSVQQSQSEAGINTIIIDNIGMLSSLYKYAAICYVGGGFGADGVHNVLEAAVYGKPVLFGPEYEKFNEATELIDNGGAKSIANALELEAALDHILNDVEEYDQMATASRSYVYSKRGSTEKILAFTQEKRLLTN